MRRRIVRFFLGAFLLLSIFSFLYPQAPSVSPKILEVRLAGTDGSQRISILMQIIEAYRLREPNKVIKFGVEALDLLQHYPDPRQELVVLNRLASACIQTGDLPSAREYGISALKLARNMGNKLAMAEALNTIGRVYWPKGNYSQAFIHFQEALAIYEELNHQPGIASAINSMGLMYLRLGDYTAALDYLLDSCRIYEGIGDKVATGDLYNSMGTIHWNLNKFDLALEYYQMSLTLYKETDMKAGIARALNNIGNFYKQNQKYTEALRYYEDSLDSSKSLGLQILNSVAQSNIGSIYESRKDYSRALRYFFNALEQNRALNNRQSLPANFLDIARVYRKWGRYQAARQHVQWALNTAEKLKAAGEMKTSEEFRDVHREFSEIYAAEGDFTNALKHYKMHKALSDDIIEESNSRKIAELQTRYEINKRESQIVLLKKNEAIIQLDLDRQQQIRNAVIGIGLLVFLSSFVLFTRYRLKTRLNSALQSEIEEHKETARKLKESEEKFRALAEQSVVGIYIYQDNLLKYINPSLALTFGYTTEETSQKTPMELTHEEDRVFVEEKLEKALAGTKDILHYEFRGITREKDVIYLESLNAHFLYQGKPAVLGSIVDITGHKQAEAELLKSRKLEAIGILAGGIAHDFNNLLAVMMGYLFMASDDDFIKQHPLVLKDLEIAEEAAVQASELVKNFIVTSDSKAPG